MIMAMPSRMDRSSINTYVASTKVVVIRLALPSGKVVLSMQLKLLILGALAPIALCSPAMALDAWVMTIERGLPVATVERADGSLRVICDPDRVFGPTSNAAVAAQLGKDGAAKPA